MIQMMVKVRTNFSKYFWKNDVTLFLLGMAIDNDDDNASEHEDVPADREIPITVRQSSLNEGEPPEVPSDQQEGGTGQGEDSDPELDLLAETESDSDDNHSNQDAASAQRSVQTGATAGSDTGRFYCISI